MTEQSTDVAHAADVLSRQGYGTTGLGLIGAGQRSVCYGAGEVAVLLSLTSAEERGPGMTGHSLPGRDGAVPSNSYALLRWLTTKASEAGGGGSGGYRGCFANWSSSTRTASRCSTGVSPWPG